MNKTRRISAWDYANAKIEGYTFLWRFVFFLGAGIWLFFYIEGGFVFSLIVSFFVAFLVIGLVGVSFILPIICMILGLFSAWFIGARLSAQERAEAVSAAEKDTQNYLLEHEECAKNKIPKNDHNWLFPMVLGLWLGTRYKND